MLGIQCIATVTEQGPCTNSRLKLESVRWAWLGTSLCTARVRGAGTVQSDGVEKSALRATYVTTCRPSAGESREKQEISSPGMSNQVSLTKYSSCVTIQHWIRLIGILLLLFTVTFGHQLKNGQGSPIKNQCLPKNYRPWIPGLRPRRSRGLFGKI